MRRSLVRLAVGFCLWVLLSALSLPSASAVYADDPIGPTAWSPDGPVHAVVASGDRVFVGGAFSGGLVALDATTHALLWSGQVNGDVRALAVSSDGSHLIAGGAFTAVAGTTHRKLASLQVAGGTVEPQWKARAGGTVRDIVIRDDIAYIGGTFKQHNGLSQQGLGAVRVSTGTAVPAFDLRTDANVYALASDGARLYVGGRFTAVSGQPRNGLASVHLATGSLEPWTPPRACDNCNLWWDVLVDGGTVYAAGRNAGAVTAFDATTGGRRWSVPANGDAQALALSDGLLYAGGHYVEIGTPRQPRTILAALDPGTGAVDPDFQPRFVTTWPGIWALTATGGRLWAGGHFTAAGPGPLRLYPYLAVFG